MYADLLILLLPLVLGYLLKIGSMPFLRFLQRILGGMVYLILFLMGISLAFVPDLGKNLLLILTYTSVTAVTILLMNVLALLMLQYLHPWPSPSHRTQPLARLHLVIDSLKLCGVVLLGFLLGLTEWSWLTYATKGSEFTLMFLLMLVGIQLRNSGMTLRQLILNRRGALVAAVTLISALCGGVIAAMILALPIKTGLALASGLGWYSLSGIMLTESFGPVIGSTAFFNDLLRELVAILFIPALVNRGRSVALGLCGSTSVDFTLPILQRSAGVEIVPAAIVHGFILSLLAPILMGLFS